MKIDGLIAAAKEGVITVEFNKINDGGLRVMPCTLNTEISKHNVQEILEQKETNDHLVVWAMDKEAWRSFRVETVIRWYEGYPETQT
jgi:hypothetical protein|tara:strand:- start:1897 stop:2157 length:261 start_codon:yes stop_codon:yes gene_type:complete